MHRFIVQPTLSHQPVAHGVGMLQLADKEGIGGIECGFACWFNLAAALS
jgi:hypothetical protein